MLKGNEKVANSMRQYEKYKDSLLKIPFVSVHDYLYELRGISTKLSQIEERAMIYAAAAVSDFYIPHSVMTQHKIQSKVCV
jgi:phosphopantothenate---cysteine ligase (ATP)